MKCVANFALVALSCLTVQFTAFPVSAQEYPDQQPYGAVLVDLFEVRPQKGGNLYVWDGQAWFGGDYERLWFKSQGSYDGRAKQLESAEVQMLYSRLLGYFFYFQAGVRHDFRPNPVRTYGVIGIQGLAPGMFEIDTQAFLSEKGDVSARFTGSYDLLITNRLILQPRLEVNAAVQPVPELKLGSGITNFEVGARLRYEVAREFAPYIGVNWERKLGETSAIAKNEGKSNSAFTFVSGIRFWF